MRNQSFFSRFARWVARMSGQPQVFFIAAHNALLDLEELEQDDLDRIRDEYEELATGARQELRGGGRDTGTPEAPVDMGQR